MDEKKHVQKVPLVRLSKRTSIERWKAWTIRGVALLAALIVCGFVIKSILNIKNINL